MGSPFQDDSITPTLAVSTSAYSSGNVVGGLLTLNGACKQRGGIALAQSLLITDHSNQKAAFDILVFNGSSTLSTFTDKSACPTLSAADQAALIRTFTVTAADYKTVGGLAIADINLGGKVMRSATGNDTVNSIDAGALFVVIVTTSTPTYATTADLIARFGLLRA